MKMTIDQKLNNYHWVISWIGSTIVAAVVLTAFIYTNFQTKADAGQAQAVAKDARTSIEKHLEENKIDTDKRLDRMDSKLDLLLERTK